MEEIYKPDADGPEKVKGIVLQVLDVVGAVVPFYFGQYAAKCLYVFQ